MKIQMRKSNSLTVNERRVLFGIFLSLCLLPYPPFELERVSAIEKTNRTGTEANKFLEALANSNMKELNRQIDASIKSQLPASKLILLWHQLVQVKGKVQKRFNPRVETIGPYQIAYIPVQFQKELLDLKISYTPQGKVSGFFVAPHKKGYELAPYAQSSAFTETSIKFGLDDWKLTGKLCLPGGTGPFPAVVLVHGSGPHDMDETVGSNKPFLDLAHGLASKGVAVLRYNKRTSEHKMNSEQIANLTIKEESLDDAIEAVKFLRGKKSINPEKIFILGHSLGGMLVPRMEKADNQVTGFISLTGSSIPMEEKIIDQFEYLASLGDEKAKTQLPLIREQASKIKNCTGSDSSGPDQEIILGASMAYWKDLKKHDPIIELKEMKKPVLFLQGERDYQVTANGDFARWKKAVANIPDAEKQFQFKLYPGLNHLFIEGSGKPNPQEYFNQTGHVEKTVIEDIANWIKQH